MKKEEQAYEWEKEEEGWSNMRRTKMRKEWAAVYVIVKSKNRSLYIHAVRACMRALYRLESLLFGCFAFIFVVFISSLSSSSSFFSLLIWFDFVECEIIIKFVGVYFVCSELYNLHEMLGKRFCTHKHTQEDTNITQLMLVRNVSVVIDDVRRNVLMCLSSQFHVRKDFFMNV